MGLKSHNHVSQTLTVTELPEHLCKKLVPASEVLDILFPIIFASEIVEMIPIKKCYQLQTYLETYADHLGRKVTKSSPLTLHTTRKRLNFSDFKERLVHFNGTVVTMHQYYSN